MWQNEGVHPDFAPWVECVPGQPRYARCKFCKGNPIRLSSMGVQSLKSHMKSKKHQDYLKCVGKMQPLAFSKVESNSSEPKSAKTNEITDVVPLKEKHLAFVNQKIWVVMLHQILSRKQKYYGY